MERRIPDLSDQELANLQANALRLLESGSVKQRQQAEELLPLIGAALEERVRARAAERAEKLEAASVKRRAGKAVKSEAP